MSYALVDQIDKKLVQIFIRHYCDQNNLYCYLSLSTEFYFSARISTSGNRIEYKLTHTHKCWETLDETFWWPETPIRFLNRMGGSLCLFSLFL